MQFECALFGASHIKSDHVKRVQSADEVLLAIVEAKCSESSVLFQMSAGGVEVLVDLQILCELYQSMTILDN